MDIIQLFCSNWEKIEDVIRYFQSFEILLLRNLMCRKGESYEFERNSERIDGFKHIPNEISVCFFYHWYRINRLNEKTSRKFIYTFTIYMYCSNFFIKIRERIIKGLLMEFHLSAILLNTYLPSIPIDLLREYIQTRSFFSVSWIE